MLQEIGGQPLVCLYLLPAVQLEEEFESITVTVSPKHRAAVQKVRLPCQCRS